jgi:hypothetical protein
MGWFSNFSGRIASKIIGHDGVHAVDISYINGVRRMRVDSLTTIEQILGRDPFADTYFIIDAAGAIGDTIRIQIAATANDPTTPDRDATAVDLTYTLVAGDVGDEIQLRDNVISYLNGQTSFSDGAGLKAQKAKDNAIVHITSKFRGKFWERPNSNDFQVTTTGTTAVNVRYDTLFQRNKQTSLDRDPDAPHELGVLQAVGSFTTVPGPIDDIIDGYLLNGTSDDMTIDGSSTPVEFKFVADSTGTYDYFIQDVSVHGQDNGIKYYSNFLAMSVLTNGLLVQATTEAGTRDLTINPIKRTEDFKHEFTRGKPYNYSFEQPPGIDDVLATLEFPQPIILRAGTSDKISIYVRDNLTSVTTLHSSAVGFRKEV